MSDAVGRIWELLHGGAPIVALLYRDETDLARWTEEVEFAFRSNTHKSTSVTAVLDEPGRAALLTNPPAEIELIEALAANRDRFIERTSPAVLFLLAGGEAVKRLADLPGLASWLRGAMIEPAAAEVLGPDDVSRFRERTGMTPGEWLAADARAEIKDSWQNSMARHWARALAGVREA